LLRVEGRFNQLVAYGSPAGAEEEAARGPESQEEAGGERAEEGTLEGEKSGTEAEAEDEAMMAASAGWTLKDARAVLEADEEAMMVAAAGWTIADARAVLEADEEVMMAAAAGWTVADARAGVAKDIGCEGVVKAAEAADAVEQIMLSEEAPSRFSREAVALQASHIVSPVAVAPIMSPVAAAHIDTDELPVAPTKAPIVLDVAAAAPIDTSESPIAPTVPIMLPVAGAAADEEAGRVGLRPMAAFLQAARPRTATAERSPVAPTKAPVVLDVAAAPIASPVVAAPIDTNESHIAPTVPIVLPVAGAAADEKAGCVGLRPMAAFLHAARPRTATAVRSPITWQERLAAVADQGEPRVLLALLQGLKRLLGGPATHDAVDHFLREWQEQAERTLPIADLMGLLDRAESGDIEPLRAAVVTLIPAASKHLPPAHLLEAEQRERLCRRQLPIEESPIEDDLWKEFRPSSFEDDLWKGWRPSSSLRREAQAGMEVRAAEAAGDGASSEMIVPDMPEARPPPMRRSGHNQHATVNM